MAGPPMPSAVLSVATIRSEAPARIAFPAKQRPLTIAIRGTTPESRAQSAKARVSRRRDDRVVGVAGASTAALGEDHRRQAHPLDQLEEAILLAVPHGPLRAGQDGVVVGDDRAGRPIAGQLAVDTRRAADQPVSRRPRQELVEVAAAALGGDREAAVLDQAALVDQVIEVLARRPRSARVPVLDRLGARRVGGQPPPLERLGEVGTDLALVGAVVGARQAAREGTRVWSRR